MVMYVLSYGIGTLVAFVLIAALLFVFIRDITQKKHGVLRNYPVIGRLRYFLEELGEYFRQYFFAGDRDELPFNRSTRGWIYRLAKNEGGIIGFGSTYDLHQSGANSSPRRLTASPSSFMKRQPPIAVLTPTGRPVRSRM